MADTPNNESASVTVRDYLIGCAGNYPIMEETLGYVSVKRDVDLDDDVTTLTVIERDMMEMEMLRYLLRAVGMTASVQDANGTWSHRDGAVQINQNDKKQIAKQLHELEAKYGQNSSSIQMHNYGVKIWH